MAALSMLRLTRHCSLLSISSFSCDVFGRNISKKRVLNQLNLPVQPKRPPTPFILFFQEIKDNLKNQDPGCNAEDLVKKSALLWKELSPDKKEEYQNKFKALRDKYSREMEKFEGELTLHQKTQLESFDVYYQNLKESQAVALMRRAKEKKLNKPKYPMPPYVRFVQDMKLDDVPLNGTWKAGKEKWHQLPERAKEKYISKFREELEQYKKDLESWEEEMIEKGHTDVVRQKTLKAKTFSDEI